MANLFARQYSNHFKIDDFISDVITGGTKADNRPNYHNMKKQFRTGDTLIISDVDRLGRNADDVIVEIKELQSRGIRVVALDVPFLNDWEKMNDDSLSKMIIDIFVTLKAHIAQQEKEKIHDRVMQGLEVAKARGKKLGETSNRGSEGFYQRVQQISVWGIWKYISSTVRKIARNCGEHFL